MSLGEVQEQFEVDETNRVQAGCKAMRKGAVQAFARR